MDSKAILASMPMHEADECKRLGQRLEARGDVLPAKDVLEGMNGEELFSVVRQHTVAALTPDAGVKTAIDITGILGGLDLKELGTKAGLAACTLIRESVLPKIQEQNGTVAFVVSNILMAIETKLRTV